MDFFAAQARAKRRTSRLVALFACAVGAIILTSYLAAVFLTWQLQGRATRRGGVTVQHYQPAPDYWQPGLFTGITVVTLAVVGCASLYKWREFAGGGAAVAESVGARRVDPRTTDLKERQLLNVVEEMAIAAGIPAPMTFLLEDESGINAFAAGLTTADAVVTVTRGALDKLTRDELQGVIGHEFSHILNGDMRLNLRIASIVFGILAIAIIGRGIINNARFMRAGSGKDQGKAVAAFMFTGVALMVIGGIGWVFGRLIQAAVSCQREFLADASSVQFTRNPAGLTGALKKIGGSAIGSSLDSHRTQQISHCFFAQSLTSDFSSLLATHPPLLDRIRAIEPKFDGKFIAPPETLAPNLQIYQLSRAKTPLPSRIPFQPAGAVATAGAITVAHFQNAQAILAAIPPQLRDAARSADQAPALVCSLLLAADPAIRTQQLDLVARQAGAGIAAALPPLLAVTVLAPEARLPLLQLALPALRSIDPAAAAQLLATLDVLVQADGVVSPFEFALQKMIARQLIPAGSPDRRIEYYDFGGVAASIAAVLSALARVGSDDEAAVAAAFAAGVAQFRQIADRLALQPSELCVPARLDLAFDQLAASSPIIKQRVLVAAAQVIGADGHITCSEEELYRALAATLDVPIPSLSAGA